MSVCEIDMVCFDLGRVLIGICDDWGEAFDRAGFERTDAVEKVLRNGIVDRAREVLTQNEMGRESSDVFYQEMGEIFGVSPKVVEASGRMYLKEVFEGVDEMLDELRGLGKKTACLSNTNDAHWAIMTGGEGKSALPTDKLDFMWASHLMGDKKPNLSIYWMAESLSGIKGERILFFDDLLENVEAARECGWRAEQVTDRDDPVGQMRGVMMEMGVLK